MATVSSSLHPSPEHIFNTLNAHHQTAALKTAIELELFTAIDEGKHRAEQIAERVKASPRGVRILSDYLAILGFLKKENESYSLTADAALFLSKHSRAYMPDLQLRIIHYSFPELA
jgi:predicted HTH transcriptional regulator